MRLVVSISFQCLLLSAASALCMADQSELKQPLPVSEPDQKVLNDAFRTAVNITVKIRCGSNESSGVMITEDGLILTVAHGIQIPQSNTEHSEGTTEQHPTIRVTLPDRTVLQAQLVVSDSNADIALLQSERTEGTRISEAAEISSGTGPRIDDVVLAGGFPGRETTGSTVVRIGSVTDADEEQFRSGCMLTSGDSGGPVVDISGAVVGLNRRIGINPDQNFHIPLRRIQTFLKNTPECSNRINWQKSQPTQLISLQPTQKSRSAMRERSVRIFRAGENPANSDPTAAGTRFSEAVVTKLSQILNARNTDQEFLCELPNGDIRTGSIIHRNLPLDLAVLQLSPRSAAVNTRSIDQNVSDTLNSDEISETCSAGLIVYAQCDLAAGIVSRCGYSEPGVSSELGATAVTNERNETYIREIAVGSAAADAGLTEGDRLISMQNTVIRNADQAAALTAEMQPGDWVSLIMERNQQLSNHACQLKFPPETRLMRSENLDGHNGGVSRRRTGFHGVIQHDTPISPEDCGGPLVAADGRLVGINIARRSRESTLAIPVESIRRLLSDVRKTHQITPMP